MKIIGVLVTATTLAFTLVVFAQDQPRPKTTRTQGFMRQKLNYSQGILEGIVTEKYDLVITNAILLRNMNLTNAFFALGNRNYRANIVSFQEKVDSLVKAGTGKNREGAAEAYSQMVGSCINCHREFRLDQFREANFIPK
jgi:hypothetical protein